MTATCQNVEVSTVRAMIKQFKTGPVIDKAAEGRNLSRRH